MSKYVQIPENEMVDFLNAQGFSEVPVAGTHEMVFSKLLAKGQYPVCMRIYSSIVRGAARDCGEDAIRVCLVTKIKDDEKETVRGFGHSKRVYRVLGWKKNLQERIDKWEGLQSPACPACSAPMVARKGKNGEFWGCLMFKHGCKGSCNMEKE